MNDERGAQSGILTDPTAARLDEHHHETGTNEELPP